MRRRHRMLWTIGIVIVVAVLLTPLLAGYGGPRAAAYAQTWRPWRTHLSVQLNPTAPGASSERVMIVAAYRDPWPGTGRHPGHQADFETVTRPSRLLPWIVTGHGTGP